MGFCLSNARWMLPNCQAACSSCGVTRADIINDAFPLSAPSSSSHPSSNRLLGPECADRNPLCPDWAADSQCTVNPGYMRIYCRTSCGICTDPIKRS